MSTCVGMRHAVRALADRQRYRSFASGSRAGKLPSARTRRPRVDYRVVRSTVIRGIGPRESPIVSITLGRSRRDVSRRATSGCAAHRHAHTSAHDRSRWRIDRLDRNRQCSFHVVVGCRRSITSGLERARGWRGAGARRRRSACTGGSSKRASTCGLPRDGPRVGARWSRCARRLRLRPLGSQSRHTNRRLG